MTYKRAVEAAGYLGVSKSFLDKKRVSGDGPRFCRFGRAVAYRTEDLDAWAAANLRQSTSETRAVRRA